MVTIRVATCNIAGAIDSDNRFYSRFGLFDSAARADVARSALDDIVRWVKDERIDVLVLQEVDVCHAGARTLHQANYLAKRLSMQVAYLPGFDYGLVGLVRVTTGVATLSRHPITQTYAVRFRQRHVTKKRRVMSMWIGAKAALHCVIRVADANIHVVNAHLTHDNDAQREYELDALISRCAKMERAVLAGDLNFSPTVTRSSSMREAAHFATDRCVEIVESYRARLRCDARLFEPARTHEIFSYPSIEPDIKLDYIFGFPAGEPLVERVHAPIGKSNHLAVSTEITWD